MSQFYNNVKTALLMGAMSGLILLAGYFLFGGRIQGVVIALVVAAVMNFVGYFFSDKIALASMHAQEVGPDHMLYKLTEKMTQRAGMPMPRVYVAPTAAPNAFATGRNPKHAAVCATQGLLDMLTPDEVSGVIGHELAHVKHRDILISTLAATIASALTVLAYSAMWGGDRRDSNPLAGLAVLLLGPLAAGIIQAAISRSREFNADAEGAKLHGDPLDLATALEKIHYGSQRVPMDVNPAFNSMFIAEPKNLRATMANLFSTHPPLEERLENLIGRPSTGRVRLPGR